MAAKVTDADEPQALPLDGWSRWNVLKAYVPYSRETIRQREAQGRFPKHTLLSERCAAWRNREVHEWLRDPAGYRVQSK